MTIAFQEKILRWYRDNRRSLPWRRTKDPYKVWLSEVILQQTRVAQGLPYYKRFTSRFPTIRHLSRAPLREVMRQWQGLGYYSRARNLHRCARTVIRELDGRFPSDYHELLKLPGVGSYTAAAIASICFDQPTAVLDGNVIRVLARHFGLSQPHASAAGRKLFTELANRLISGREPGNYNQAIMEFGALHCVPRNPDCGNCPLARSCEANRRGVQHELPVKKPKSAPRSRWLYYCHTDSVTGMLMRRRPEGDIWSGLYEFPLIEKKKRVKPEIVWREIMGGTASAGVMVTGPVRHLLSHQVLYLHFLRIRASKEVIRQIRLRIPFCKTYTRRQVRLLPKPIPLVRYLAKAGAA